MVKIDKKCRGCGGPMPVGLEKYCRRCVRKGLDKAGVEITIIDPPVFLGGVTASSHTKDETIPGLVACPTCGHSRALTGAERQRAYRKRKQG